jgi:hypothetical protein
MHNKFDFDASIDKVWFLQSHSSQFILAFIEFLDPSLSSILLKFSADFTNYELEKSSFDLFSQTLSLKHHNNLYY